MAKKEKKVQAGPIRELELTLKDLAKMRPAFDALRVMKIKGGKGARRIGKLLAILQIEYQDYDDQAQKLIKEFGEEKPEGIGHWINGENKEQVKKFSKAHEDLLEAEVDLRFRPITVDDFGDVEVPMFVMSEMQDFFDFQDDEIEDKTEEQEADEEETSEETSE